MKQCPACMKWFDNDQQRCPDCCVQLSENEVSSEDASDGTFATGESHESN